MDKSKTRIIIIAIVLLVIIALGIVAFFMYKKIDKVVNRNVIYEGITIEGIDVGGLPKDEACRRIDEEVKSMLNHNRINICYKESDKNYELDYAYFEFKSNLNEVIDKAYDIAKKGKLLDRYNKIKELQQGQIDFNLTYNYNAEKIDEFLASIKNDFSTEPKNAIIHRKNNVFIIDDEVVGQNLNIQESKTNILHSLDKKGYEASLVIDEVTPQYTKAYFSQVKDVIGTAYTEFNANKVGRTENLRIASNFINGTVLMPGEVFSTHSTISPINTKNGYKPAPIFVNGKVEDGIGGGVCQVATTLYNAVLKAEMDIIERKNHSMPVTYISLGKDATIAGSLVDFKFKNNYDYPIFIESYLSGNKLHMVLFSKENRAPNRTIEFEAAIIKKIPPPPEKVTVDPGLNPGQRKVVRKSQRGYIVKLYKKVYVDKQLKETILVNDSYYRPISAEVRVGKKAVETFNVIDEETINKDNDQEPIEEDNVENQPIDEQPEEKEMIEESIEDSDRIEDEIVEEENDEEEVIEIDDIDINANDVFDQIDEGVTTEDENGESSRDDS